MNNQEETTAPPKKFWYSIILILLLLSAFGNLTLLLNRSNMKTERDTALLAADSSLSVKLQVEKYLNEAQTTLNNCKSNNDELNATVLKLNKEIAEKRSVIEKITKDNNSR